MDGRSGNGGHSTAGKAGRPKKVDEELANIRIARALKGIYKQDENEDNVNSFLVEFITTERGQMFVAQHLLGKPKETKDITTNGKDIVSNIVISDEALKNINDSIENEC